jgi:hypothetical protein
MVLFRKRMKREAEISSHLEHHAVTVYHGLFVEEGQLGDPLADYYLVSGFVNGGLAKAYLAQHRTPEVAEKLVGVPGTFACDK